MNPQNFYGTCIFLYGCYIFKGLIFVTFVKILQ